MCFQSRVLNRRNFHRFREHRADLWDFWIDSNSFWGKQMKYNWNKVKSVRQKKKKNILTVPYRVQYPKQRRQDLTKRGLTFFQPPVAAGSVSGEESLYCAAHSRLQPRHEWHITASDGSLWQLEQTPAHYRPPFSTAHQGRDLGGTRGGGGIYNQDSSKKRSKERVKRTLHQTEYEKMIYDYLTSISQCLLLKSCMELQ